MFVEIPKAFIITVAKWTNKIHFLLSFSLSSSISISQGLNSHKSACLFIQYFILLILLFFIITYRAYWIMVRIIIEFTYLTNIHLLILLLFFHTINPTNNPSVNPHQKLN